jgi:hypothetical protein
MGNSVRRLLQGSVLVSAALGLTGCVQSRVAETRETGSQIVGNEAIVILAKPQIEGAGAEDRFMDCLGKQLTGGPTPIAVRDNNQFVDDMFPWFEPSTAPTRPAALVGLLTRPGVSEQVAASGVRYVVWLDGSTRKTDGGGSIACGAAPGAAGCVGFGWWEKESNYEATVWDIKTAKSAGSIDTKVHGTSAMVGVIVPLPFIARVEGTACDRMSDQLRVFFTGNAAGAAPSGK